MEKKYVLLLDNAFINGTTSEPCGGEIELSKLKLYGFSGRIHHQIRYAQMAPTVTLRPTPPGSSLDLMVSLPFLLA